MSVQTTCKFSVTRGCRKQPQVYFGMRPRAYEPGAHADTDPRYSTSTGFTVIPTLAW